MRRAALLLLLAGGAAVAAPAGGPGGLPPLPADAPTYGEPEFLADAMACVELVAVGHPHRDELWIDHVLAGKPTDALIVRPGVIKIVGPRFAASPGLWLLVRAPSGYYALNPSAAPLPEATWKTLAPMLPAVPGQDVVVEDHPDRLAIFVGEHMKERLTLELDNAGRLIIVHHAPARGRGLWLELTDGKLQEFSSTLDGKPDGLTRDYDDKGRPRSETSWRAGLRDGPAREWSDGALVRDVVYEHGLAQPVMHWKGKPGTVIEQSEQTNLYKAPARVRDRIKVGMTAKAVLALVKADFSLSDGIDFDYTCNEDLHVSFEHDRVSAITPRFNSNICDY